MEARVQGSTNCPVWDTTFGPFLRSSTARSGSKTALVVPWQAYSATFGDLDKRSKAVALALLRTGVKVGDHIGIMAGNRREYIDIFLGAARIGCLTVCMNNTYTAGELRRALIHSSCTRLFIASSIGSRDTSDLIHAATLLSEDPEYVLREVNVIGKCPTKATTYDCFLKGWRTSNTSDSELQVAETRVRPTDGILLQFTSGTTGQPKASILTSQGILNNALHVGNRMELTTDDIVVCPPPLFHTFGIVVGFLVALLHSCRIILPSDTFNVEQTVQAVSEHRATALLGVPTMFLAELDWIAKAGIHLSTLRTGIIGGTTVSRTIMERIEREMCVKGMLIAYGMTETSPITFTCSLADRRDARLESVGQVLPNTSAKVIDKDGKTLTRGERGELCISGYCLHVGYYRHSTDIKASMEMDDNGVLWIHTGDECFIDYEGYCHITGRLKDIIIRGGENIYPAEIEECFLNHKAIVEASVVGIKHEYYGEVAAAFLKCAVNVDRRPDDAELRSFVGASLGRHKVPEHVFWIGDRAVGEDFPMTGSGKHQKHILSRIGFDILSTQQHGCGGHLHRLR